jgi:hypothetical protein
MLSMSGRFLPPHAEEDEEEAAEGEHDAEDVDTVCRSIRPTMPRRATAEREREREQPPREREREREEACWRRRDSG